MVTLSQERKGISMEHATTKGRTMNNFEKIVFETIKFWVGKENNPLNGRTFEEIYNLSISIGKEKIQKNNAI